MVKKAEAFQLYQEAAQLDMLLEKLPQVWGFCGSRRGGTELGIEEWWRNKSLGRTNQARGLEMSENYKLVSRMRTDGPHQ